MPGLDLAMAAALGVALVLVVAPGFALASVLGLRGLARIALAGPLTVALVGVTGVALAALGVDFSPISVGASAALLIALAAVGARLLRSRTTPAEPTPRRTLLVGVAGITIATVLITLYALAALPRPDAISQTYDAVFHLSAIASIVDTGNASSLELYRFVYPGTAVPFYPAGFHSLAALVVEMSPADVPRATTATWVATSALIWVPGVVWLTDLLLSARVRRRSVLVGAAAVLAALFGGAPYLLLVFGTLYPMGFATGLLPSGVALAALVLSRGLPSLPRDPSVWRPAVLAGLWVVAGIVAHPRTVFGLAVLVLPLLAAIAIVQLRRHWNDPERRRNLIRVLTIAGGAMLLLAAAAIAVAYRYYRVGARPISDRLNGGPAQADQSVLDAIVQAIGQIPPLGLGQTPLWPAFPIAALLIIGVAVALRDAERRWIPVALLLVAALYVLAASSDSDLAKVLTAPWYKDKYRLYALLPVLGVPLAAWGLSRVVDLSSRITRRPARGVALALAAALAVTGMIPAAVGMNEAAARIFAIPETTKNGAIADEETYRMMATIAEVVPEGQRLLGDPWNGSALSWALAGVEPVFPHLTGGWGPLRRKMLREFPHLRDREQRASVCALLARLDVEYVLVDSERLSNRTREESEFGELAYSANPRGFELVAKEGSAELYRITNCG